MLRHAGGEDLRDAAVLVADQPVDILPLGLVGIGRRVHRIVGDVAGAARHADAERRLDRAVEQPVGAGVAVLLPLGQELAIRVPSGERAVELAPFLRVEARIGKLAQAERAGGCAEQQVARALALIDLAVPRADVERSVLEVAGGVAIALPADELQKLLVALAVLEAVGLFERARRTVRIAGNAAVRVGRDAPALEQVALVLRGENLEPVDRGAQPLRERIGVEAVVERGREEPDLAARARRRRVVLVLRRIAGIEFALRACAVRQGGKGRDQHEKTFFQAETRAHLRDPPGYGRPADLVCLQVPSLARPLCIYRLRQKYRASYS